MCVLKYINKIVILINAILQVDSGGFLSYLAYITNICD